MRYKCNICHTVITVTPTGGNVECDVCGVKYNAQNKGSTGKATDGGTSEEAGRSVSNLQGKPVGTI